MEIDEKQLKVLFDKYIDDYATKNQYSVSKVPAHNHDGVNSFLIKGFKDLFISGILTVKDTLGNEYLLYASNRVGVAGVELEGDIYVDGDVFAPAGKVECQSFKIDQTPAVGTITPDKTITIDCNGTNYKIAVKQA